MNNFNHYIIIKKINIVICSISLILLLIGDDHTNINWESITWYIGYLANFNISSFYCGYVNFPNCNHAIYATNNLKGRTLPIPNHPLTPPN